MGPIENKRTTILRLKHVLARTGIGRSTVYMLIARNDFPQPISLGARSVGWLESDIESWIVTRAKANPKIQSAPPKSVPSELTSFYNGFPSVDKDAAGGANETSNS